jgi:hypothetical protein
VGVTRFELCVVEFRKAQMNPHHAYVDGLNQSFFSGRLSPAVVESLSALPVARDDVRAFVERMFRTMTGSGFDASDVSVLQGQILGSLLSRLLPETWAGRVPPVTVAGRHSKIDELVQRVVDPDGRGGRLFVDMACGFPPVTSVDTANALSGWEIVGLDLALPAYLVHDDRTNYAVFDEDRCATYFQSGPGSGAADWLKLMQDWEDSRRYFETLLQTLLDERARQGSNADTFEHQGAKLETNPPHLYERPTSTSSGQRWKRPKSQAPASFAASTCCFTSTMRFARRPFARSRGFSARMACSCAAATGLTRPRADISRTSSARDGCRRPSSRSASTTSTRSASSRGTRCTTTRARCICSPSSLGSCDRTMRSAGRCSR